MSFSIVLGYFSKSFGLSNCVGLTKMLTTTQSFSILACSTKETCPICKAPIVGTNPMVLRFVINGKSASFSEELDLCIFILKNIKTVKIIY